APLPEDAPVPLLYIDPAWRFKVWASTGMERVADNHYTTMEFEELCALSIAACATKDSVALTWRTASNQTNAERVVNAWGFAVKSEIIWEKSGIGMGFYVRDCHEVLMICTRGSLPCPAEKDRPRSVQHFAKHGHSEKPHAFYNIIERMYPGVRKREFFGRNWC